MACFYVVPMLTKYTCNKFRIEAVEVSYICKHVAISGKPWEYSISVTTKIQVPFCSLFSLVPMYPLGLSSVFFPLASQLCPCEHRMGIKATKA